ncbi:MAG TPA: TPM domain-containing protein [Gemmatimonadaceae bacterium]|nr:TPM domain-containing protein [Gemmatimonadaceae bacterium]
MIHRLLLACCLLPAALGAQGALFPARPTGFVSDFADVIPAELETRMTRLIEIVRAGSQGEIAVVTLRDIGNREALDVALEIGRAWGVGARADIGDRARNAGVVVLLVPKETASDGSGQIAISVGQGAEGFITDGIAGDMRREATPLLAQGNYGEGLALITARLAQRYSTEFDFALDSTLVPRQRPREIRIPPIVIIIAIMLIVSLINSGGGGGGRGGRRRRGVVVLPFPMGGGFGGGGFGGGGFGGGGFGGFGGGGGFSGGGSGGRF